jgi:hypothetical protein
MKPQAKAAGGKVRKVMQEFGAGTLKSSSGQKVINPKQAIAIGLSEQRRMKGMNTGGRVPPMPPAKREPEPRPSNWQDVQDAKTREKEDKAIRERRYAEGGIASNPRFEKTIGADRKMGADYLSADRKQKRFMSGTSTQAKVNRQNTRHGKIDMPFSQLNKYAGMRHGGKVKKYAGGGHLENTDESQSFKDAFREARSEGVKTFTWRGKKYSTSVGGGAKDYGGEAARMARHNPKPQTEFEPDYPAQAVTGRTDKASKSMPSAEQKEKNTKEFATTALGALAGGAAGRALATGAKAMNQAARDRAVAAMEKAARGTEKQGLARIGRQNEERFLKNRRDEAAYDARRASDMEAGFRKGGNVMKAKMETRHAKAMKKAGLPKAMVREEMAEAKKYAKGGGIESRGKTKGTVIRMASGGSVRGGGCEQRGKTKGRMV